jgi:hypothetical protein
MDILALSAGSLENLKRWTRMAINDYRDVLTAAEHPDSEMGVRILRTFRERRPDNSFTFSVAELVEEDRADEPALKTAEPIRLSESPKPPPSRIPPISCHQKGASRHVPRPSRRPNSSRRGIPWRSKGSKASPGFIPRPSRFSNSCSLPVPPSSRHPSPGE